LDSIKCDWTGFTSGTRQVSCRATFSRRITSSADAGYGLAIQPDGKAVVAGVSAGDFAIARFTTAGVLDTTFEISTAS
jgi:hypothetical protein